MKRGLGATRNALRQIFFQRCFYLFVTLLAMIVLAPFIEGLIQFRAANERWSHEQ